MSRREHNRFPIRLSVRYPSARSLLGDYTRSISKGGVAIESGRDLPIGTEFVFEMSTPELAESVEVRGRVVWTRASNQAGKFTLGIQYQFADTERRQRLERVIETILAEHRWERQRKHPRVPVSIEVHGQNRIWLMRDLSQGGTMLQATTEDTLGIVVGQKTWIELRVEQFDTGVAGEVVWVAQPYTVQQEPVLGRLGVQFDDVEPEIAGILDQIMRTHVQPERAVLVVRPLPKRGLD